MIWLPFDYQRITLQGMRATGRVSGDRSKSARGNSEERGGRGVCSQSTQAETAL